MSEMIKVCGLWKSNDKNNNPILSGNLTYGTKILILKNTFKKKDSDPDYNLFIAKVEKNENAKQESQQEEIPF